MTKVLFLTHVEADYGEYFLYNGLCELLGPENVIDYPYKGSYHGQLQTYPSVYGAGYGQTAPFAFAKARPGQPHTKDEVLDLLKSGAFHCAIAGSFRRDVKAALKELRGAIHCPLVLQDGEDHDHVALPQAQAMGIHLYLKRELQQETYDRHRLSGVIPKLHPFTFSWYMSEVPTLERDIDVLCALGRTHPSRDDVVARLDASGFKVDTGRYAYDEYMTRLARAKIAVAPRGWGYDTVRRWEVPGSGALLMGERLPILDDPPWRDGENCALWGGTAEMLDKIRHYLDRPNELAKVAAAGQVFVNEHHSNLSRARQLLSLL